MTSLTVQLVLKITPELDKQIDAAFDVAKEHGTSKALTRTDYIREALEKQCAIELIEYRSVKSHFVKDSILNQIIWTIFSRANLQENEDIPFRALHLDEFISGSRVQVEEVFEYLSSIPFCCKVSKDHRGFTTLSDFRLDELKKVALQNLKPNSGMDIFGQHISKWNTDKGVPISDICFSMFRHIGMHSKDALGQDGFLITKDSNCHTSEFMKGVIADGPSDYSKVLWNIPFFKKGETHQSLYVTFPDIYIGQK